MITYICFLRGINVGGNNMIPMDELKLLFSDLGFRDVKTYIQSGNVVFRFKNTPPDKLEKLIKEAIQKKFGLNIENMIRTLKELKDIIDRNPFPDAEGNKAYITFLQTNPLEIPLDAINKVKAPSESLIFSDREIYVHCPEGYGKTKLSNNFLEKKLKIPGTSRNLNTVHYLYNLASGDK